MSDGRLQMAVCRWQKKFFSVSCLLSSVFCLLSSVACAQQSGIELSQEGKVQKAREYYAAGKQLMQQGDYSAADAQFKKAQTLLKDSSQVLTDTALLENTKSLPVVNRAAEPPDASSGKRALEAAKQGASLEAITLYQKAISRAKPPQANLYYNLAVEYLKIKRFREAAQMFKRATQLNPKDKDAYFNLAVLYESYLNDKKQALDYYAQYLKYALPADNTAEVKEWMRQIKKELKTQ